VVLDAAKVAVKVAVKPVEKVAVKVAVKPVEKVAVKQKEHQDVNQERVVLQVLLNKQLFHSDFLLSKSVCKKNTTRVANLVPENPVQGNRFLANIAPVNLKGASLVLASPVLASPENPVPENPVLADPVPEDVKIFIQR